MITSLPPTVPFVSFKNIFNTLVPIGPCDLQHQPLAVIVLKVTLIDCILPLLSTQVLERIPNNSGMLTPMEIFIVLILCERIVVHTYTAEPARDNYGTRVLQ